MPYQAKKGPLEKKGMTANCPEGHMDSPWDQLSPKLPAEIHRMSCSLGKGPAELPELILDYWLRVQATAFAVVTSEKAE